MAASTRIKAQNIKFLIGATEYACDATMVDLVLGDAPGDVQTFCEQRVGGEWALTLEGITSGDATSLYRVLWANFGTTGTFTIAPNGNATATASEPHYSGTVRFNEIPPLTLNSNETASFSVTLEVVNTPHDPDTNVYYGVTIATS
tara:strand:+ start:755 stop:1192 length:438 start_codon:yes stop_codon:yes gene_type:complete